MADSTINEDGSVTINFPEIGKSFVFVPPAEWSLDPDSKDWHSYTLSGVVDMSDVYPLSGDVPVTLSEFQYAIRQQSAPEWADILPGANLLYYDSDLPASTGSETNTFFFGSVFHVVSGDGSVVINATQGAHLFSDGFVATTSYEISPGVFGVIVYGAGNTILQDTWVGDTNIGWLAGLSNSWMGSLLFPNTRVYGEQAFWNEMAAQHGGELVDRQRLDFLSGSDGSPDSNLQEFLDGLGNGIHFSADSTTLASGYDKLIAWDTTGDGTPDAWIDPMTGRTVLFNYRGRTPAQEDQAERNLENLKNLLGTGPNNSSEPSGPNSNPSNSAGSNSSNSSNSNIGNYGGDRDGDGTPNWKDFDDGVGWLDTAKPIILDLTGDGIKITELSQSQMFVDANNDGLKNQIAWAGAGDGVLFYDPENTGEITETRQFIFTEWDPTAASDLEAIASVFDTNGDGVLNANDAARMSRCCFPWFYGVNIESCAELGSIQ